MAEQITQIKLIGNEPIRSREFSNAFHANGAIGILDAADNAGRTISQKMKANGEWRSGEVTGVVANPAFDVYRRASSGGPIYNNIAPQAAGSNYAFSKQFIDSGIHFPPGEFIDGAISVTRFTGRVTNNDAADAKISIIMEPNGNAYNLTTNQFWGAPGGAARPTAFLMETASANGIVAGSGTNALSIEIVGHAYRDPASSDQGQIWFVRYESNLAVSFVTSVDFGAQTTTTRTLPYVDVNRTTNHYGSAKAWDFDTTDTNLNIQWTITGPGDGTTLLEIFAINSYLIR